jgi:hypothetical protein
MNQKLRAAIEAGFRRLPVVRSAYAERDALRSRLFSTESKLAAANASLAAHALRCATGPNTKPLSG